jgi:hypothetical protein
MGKGEYYRILAGHNDRVKSNILGDWLRHDFISIFSTHKITNADTDTNSKTFREMPAGAKVVVYTTGHVFAIGEVTGDIQDGDVNPPCKGHSYRNWRKVHWIKVGKLSSKNLPPSLRNIGLPPASFIKQISEDEYHTILALL